MRFISARLTLKQSNERLKQLNKGEDSKQENDETILALKWTYTREYMTSYPKGKNC